MILLVDDEPDIIKICGEVLGTLGYDVLGASNGKEAIETFHKDYDKIDLVILDMILPDMDGGETYKRLKQINPDIKVLISSGSDINGKAKEILSHGCHGFIQKPYDLFDLSKKLTEILGKN
jgi:CheY-like chemotaxis protein